MVVGFTNAYTISAYHHYLSCAFEPRSWRGVLDTTLCYKVCQWLSAGRCFSPGTPIFSTNKTDRHVMTEILLKVALSTIKQKKCSGIMNSINFSPRKTINKNTTTFFQSNLRIYLINEISSQTYNLFFKSIFPFIQLSFFF